MIFIGDDIIKRLQDNLTFPKVTVKNFYSVSKVVPPMVTVYERPGQGVIFPDGMPRIVRNAFQIEIYCKQHTIDGFLMTANQSVETLLLQVAEIMETVFGLTQVGEVEISPYVSDPTVMRGIVRYRGDIDVKTKFIYR